MQWTRYIWQRLSEAGVTLQNAWEAEPPTLIKEHQKETPYAELHYIASGPALELTFGIRLQGSVSKLNAAMRLNEPCFLDEIISLQLSDERIDHFLDPQPWILFGLKNDKAIIETRDLGKLSEFSINYERGVEYDAKTVVDDIIANFLKDYQKKPT